MLAFESMANNILCPDAQNPSLKFTPGNACKSTFLTFKDFPSLHHLKNQLFLYDKPGGKWAHTHPTLEKATAPYLLCSPVI